MKIYIILKKYSHETSGWNTGIEKVFTEFKKTMDYLSKNQEKWGYKKIELEGVITTINNYFDIETSIIDKNSSELFFVVYKNSNGFYNNPKIFQNRKLAEIEVENNFKSKTICKLESILIDK